MSVFGVVLLVLGIIYDLTTCQADDDGLWVALLGSMIVMISSSGGC